MNDIFTQEWYDAMFELTNSREDLAQRLPLGEWKIVIELEGDDISPYTPKGEFKYFYIYILDGKMLELRSVDEKIKEKGLKLRITGPASVFENIVAGLDDPIEKVLEGTLAIRGDMRLLMQNADLANIICEVYMNSETTSWPKGKPPYDK